MKFKLAQPSQRELIHRWLSQEHVAKWLHGKGLRNTLEDLDRFFEGSSIYQHWIAYDEETPLAYLLTSPEGEEAVTLDLFIGATDYLGKGLATAMIRQFLLTHFPDKKEVFIDPEGTNRRAVHVYEKVGFKIVAEFIAPWHPVPHYKMRLPIEDLRSRLWTAERTIEPEAALQRIQEQFPQLDAKEIRLLGAGWDNSAFLVDGEWVFRFPRRECALPLLEAEWCALPKIAPRLPLTIPVPLWKGAPTPEFPWPFIGYRMIPGVTACYVNLTEGERAQLAEPLGHFLARLHAIPPAEIAHCAIPGDNRSRIDGAQLLPKTEANFKELNSLGLMEKGVVTLIDRLQNCRAPTSSALVHGDFYVRHLLVDDRRHLSGVIDWGDVHVGDPAIDLAIAHSFLPISAHARFKQSYGEISEETWALAKLRAIYVSSYLVLFAHHSGDSALLREGVRSLKVMSQAS